MAQKSTQYAAGARGHARQTVADGRVRCTRREGPIHIPVTRWHASTNCAENSEDRSTCDADSVTHEQVAAAEAEHRRGPKSAAAQPIPKGRDVVPPCLGASQDTKLFRTDLWQHGENTAKGMIAVLPFVEHFSSGQAASR
ncbi:hypothetical protein TcCL_Unassigned00010 [Trypanosoma cruzi]|nr:hypothetical protein TcCL_Unassigned00010 [Trypanosoma cruzi]